MTECLLGRLCLMYVLLSNMVSLIPVVSSTPPLYTDLVTKEVSFFVGGSRLRLADAMYCIGSSSIHGGSSRSSTTSSGEQW